MENARLDTLARVLARGRSRRATWRLLLGAALLGTAARPAAAKRCGRPGTRCGDVCCPRPGICFAKCDTGKAFCCTGEEYVVCGDQCCLYAGPDTCQSCRAPSRPGGETCGAGIAGSYRRPR